MFMVHLACSILVVQSLRRSCWWWCLRGSDRGRAGERERERRGREREERGARDRAGEGESRESKETERI